MKFLDLEGLGYFATKLIEKLPSIVREIINDIGFNKVNSSTTNGNILLDDIEIKVYTLPDATASVLGGVKVGTNVSVSNGTISVANGSTSAKGVVQLTDSTTSTSTTTAATPNSVKSAYDLANTAKTVADGKANSSHNHTVANITDLTATATELNYTDGVTSNIQTQLNGKAASSHTHNYAGSSSPGGAATNSNALGGYNSESYMLSYGNYGANYFSSNDLNNWTRTGCYAIQTGCTNIPAGKEADAWGTIYVIKGLSDRISQFAIFWNESGNPLWHRCLNSSTWSTWTKVRDDGNANTVDGFHASTSTGSYLRPINYGTNTMTPGTSALATGTIYLQYE